MDPPLMYKLNVKTGFICLAFLLIVCGVWLICKEIHDAGAIDIKTPILQGRVTSGLVGISLLFFAVVLCGLATFISSRNIKFDGHNQLKITRTKAGAWDITYSGKQMFPSDWDRFAKAVRDVLEKTDEMERSKIQPPVGKTIEVVDVEPEQPAGG